MVAQAAVEDADESVGQGAQGLVVGDAAGAVVVVVSAGAGRGLERGEGLVVQSIGQAPVTGIVTLGGVPQTTTHLPFWAEAIAGQRVDADPRVIGAQQDAERAHLERTR